MKYLRPVIAIVVVMAAIASVFWYVMDPNAGGLPDGFATENGRLEANQIDIATKTPGRIAEIRMSEGELVQAGDVLAVVDTRELAAQLARANVDAVPTGSRRKA